MTDIDLNKRLHEILGLCWHERSANDEFKCAQCPRFLSPDREIDEYRIDFLTWEGFGILWKWLLTRHGYEGFMHKHRYGSEQTGWYLKECYISPRLLAETVVEFFEEAK